MANLLNAVGGVIRALVVEDDPSWQQLLTEILSDMGLIVDVADQYDAALEKMRAESHRLAILDLSLGGTDHNNQDGLRVAEALQRHDPGCVILFLTGFATVELAVHVMQERGAFTCLQKEAFRRADFRKVIHQALAQAPALPVDFVAAPSTPPAAKAAPAATAEVARLGLVVEDDAGWRELLIELLTDAGYQVRASSSYVEALGLLKREKFTLAVLDLSLASSLSESNLDGYRLLAATRKAQVPAIVVSGYADPARIEQAYAENLIYACLEKQAFDRKTFLHTVENLKPMPEAVDPAMALLTEREREVLALLAQGLTNKEIARDLCITANTVKRHLKSLFLKLEVNTRSAASARATRMGLGKKE